MSKSLLESRFGDVARRSIAAARAAKRIVRTKVHTTLKLATSPPDEVFIEVLYSR